jgi:hypothetical protein
MPTDADRAREMFGRRWALACARREDPTLLDAKRVLVRRGGRLWRISRWYATCEARAAAGLLELENTDEHTG